MRSHSLHIAVAALLTVSSLSSRAQESRPEEVIVTSTALRETSLDIAQPAAVLSGDELRRQIAASIGESIATQPGVSASYFGPSASRPVIRGLSGERVLMLEDSLSSLDASALSADHAVAVESVLADQIEILKGPAALLFGSGAVGGVVNVVDGRIPTDFAPDADRFAFEVRGDTALDERTAVGRVDVGGERLRVHVDGFRRETDDVEIPDYAFSAAESRRTRERTSRRGVRARRTAEFRQRIARRRRRRQRRRRARLHRRVVDAVRHELRSACFARARR